MVVKQKRKYVRKASLANQLTNGSGAIDNSNVQTLPPVSRDFIGSRAKRAVRVPLGAPRLKLKVHAENPNVVHRWVNDKGGRLESALEGGYRFAASQEVGITDVIPGNTDPGSRTSKVVGINEDGSPLRAYLMEIDKETYNEDQAAKEAAVQVTEAAIRSGNPDGKVSDGRYIPTEGIRIRQG